MIGALLKLLRELRHALIKLLVDDPEHGEPHRRITAWIKTLPISAHHAGPYRRARAPRCDPVRELRLTQSADFAQLHSRPVVVNAQSPGAAMALVRVAA